MSGNRIRPTWIKGIPRHTYPAYQSNGVLFAAAVFLQPVAVSLPGRPGLVSAQETIVLPNSPPFIQKPNPNKLVVFIHGINGDPVKTWTNEDLKFFWPRELAEDPDFTHADVLSFGYESECGPSLNIREIATHLHTTLEAAVAKIPYRSLSFVAHSMGGLVVREFILTHLHKLKVPLDSMVLLSTPNWGSSLANVAKAFCKSDSLMDLRDGRSGYL
ncbi:MAG: alpha/beta fold hydrolase, partial [Nitrospirae bacterium]|nr:alpha/beta fold hydrolase [Nitrospirota bacterium]